MTAQLKIYYFNIKFILIRFNFLSSVKANGVLPDGIKSATIDAKSAEISEDTDTSSISSRLSESTNEDNVISAKLTFTRNRLFILKAFVKL